jgi:exodeoxyribonuclease-5
MDQPMSITLTPQQDKAVHQFADWFRTVGDTYHDFAPVYIQQGFAGTGKTTVLPFFIEAANLDPMTDVTFCAPTGKAAKVMTKKLRAQGINKTAITIHKAMYRVRGLKAYALEAELKAAIDKAETAGPAARIEIAKTIKMLQRDLERAYDSTAPAFSLEPDSPNMRAPIKLIVVDEASMVGEMIADDMLFFGTPILAIGDPGQLQPVGDNPGFFTRPPDNIFTEIHRQALDNPIIWASKLIREGNDIPYGKHGDGQLHVVDQKHDEATFDLDRDKQIIVGTNARRHRITRKCRELVGLHTAGPTTNEMMLITKNSRKYPNLVNGTMIVVTEDTGDLKQGNITCPLHCVDEDGFTYRLNAIQGILEENYLGPKQYTAAKNAVFHAMQSDQNHHADWAYAITCHKSQGSQWDEVVVHDESNVFARSGQGPQWLYTAVTRAASTLTLVK